MISPNKEVFEQIIKNTKAVPIVKEISGDTETPITLFQKLSRGKSYLLESGEGARYSFIGRDPFLRIESRGEEILIEENGIQKKFKGKVLEKTQEILKKYQYPANSELPDFLGGAVGYIGYDILSQYENLVFENEEDMDLPEGHLLLTKEVVVYDHFHQKIILVVNVDADKESYEEGLLKIEDLEKEIRENTAKEEIKNEDSFFTMKSNVSKEEFMDNVTKAKEYIKKGEIDQVVLSQRFEVETSKKPFETYRELRSLNPSPYMYYLDFEEYKIAGSSPEILVKATNGEVETCPIAGTRPRGESKEIDEERIKDLLSDPKELKEHMMLVDLAQEDLGRISKEGSIHITELKKIKKYSHVLHIVSHVKSEIKEELNVIDALIACLPAGTVSGAPKKRALEIIEELENKKRGVYAGAVGYIGFNGNLDMAIAIRTIVFDKNKAYVQAGAGIVEDSQPEKEYYETVSKAQALVEILKTKEALLSQV